jgi:hypothetical protein
MGFRADFPTGFEKVTWIVASRIEERNSHGKELSVLRPASSSKGTRLFAIPIAA